MTLKIDRFRTRVRLSGELRSENLDQVKAEINCCGTSVVLDIEEVDLVDVESVRFLNACEANGVPVEHCSPYIKAWMFREREEQSNPKTKEE
jgi:hypothetical protein